MAATSPSAAAGAAPSLCALCDAVLNPMLSYACDDCPADENLTCTACAIDLHRPQRMQRHRLARRDAPATEVGHGFCGRCIAEAAGEPAQLLRVRLAVVECPECAPLNGGRAKPLCLECDQLVHQSIDMDEHTRLTFDEPEEKKLMQSELYTLAGVDRLTIYHRDAMESYAGRIWPGSMMLARYCEQLAAEQPNLFKGARILELGCGCAAIPSMACYLLGATSLLCTDMNRDGLATLDDNIDALEAQMQARGIMRPISAMKTRRLAFGDDVPDLAGRFDFILGSYILYDPDSFAPLVRTLDQIVPPVEKQPCLVLLTSHEPTREGVFLDQLIARGFVCERIPFSLQTAQLNDDQHASDAKSNIGTGLRSTSILSIRRAPTSADAASSSLAPAVVPPAPRLVGIEPNPGPGANTLPLDSTWSPGMIVLSYLIASLGSMMALELMKQRTAVKGKRNWLLLIGGSISLGAIGIFSMHFIGMMALTITDPRTGDSIMMGFAAGLTLLSLFLPVAILIVGFFIAGNPTRPRMYKNIAAGVVGGLAVAAMHFVGMLSMVSAIHVEWRPGIIVLSILIGIVVATVAMLIFFRFGRLWQNDLRLQFATSLIMGVAVCSMHYTGMQSVTYSLDPTEIPPDLTGYATGHELLAAILTGVGGTLLIFLGARIRYHRLLKLELEKVSCLALAAIVVDPTTNSILVGPTGAPPQVIIDRFSLSDRRRYSHSGSSSNNGTHINSGNAAAATSGGSITQAHAAFLRIFRTGFDWESMLEYEAKLIGLSASGASQQAKEAATAYTVHSTAPTPRRTVDTAVIALYSKFARAAEQLSKQMGVPLKHFGKIYWQPEHSLISIVFDPQLVAQAALAAAPSPPPLRTLRTQESGAGAPVPLHRIASHSLDSTSATTAGGHHRQRSTNEAKLLASVLSGALNGATTVTAPTVPESGISPPMATTTLAVPSGTSGGYSLAASFVGTSQQPLQDSPPIPSRSLRIDPSLGQVDGSTAPTSPSAAGGIARTPTVTKSRTPTNAAPSGAFNTNVSPTANGTLTPAVKPDLHTLADHLNAGASEYRFYPLTEHRAELHQYLRLDEDQTLEDHLEKLLGFHAKLVAPVHPPPDPNRLTVTQTQLRNILQRAAEEVGTELTLTTIDEWVAALQTWSYQPGQNGSPALGSVGSGNVGKHNLRGHASSGIAGSRDGSAHNSPGGIGAAAGAASPPTFQLAAPPLGSPDGSFIPIVDPASSPSCNPMDGAARLPLGPSEFPSAVVSPVGTAATSPIYTAAPTPQRIPSPPLTTLAITKPSPFASPSHAAGQSSPQQPRVDLVRMTSTEGQSGGLSARPRNRGTGSPRGSILGAATPAPSSFVPSGAIHGVRSVRDLIYVAGRPGFSAWNSLSLPPEVKTALYTLVRAESELGHYPPQEMQARAPRHENAQLGVALYYTQASGGRGLQVLLPNGGPYGMTPLVPLEGNFDDARQLLADLLVAHAQVREDRAATAGDADEDMPHPKRAPSPSGFMQKSSMHDILAARPIIQSAWTRLEVAPAAASSGGGSTPRSRRGSPAASPQNPQMTLALPGTIPGGIPSTLPISMRPDSSMFERSARAAEDGAGDADEKPLLRGATQRTVAPPSASLLAMREAFFAACAKLAEMVGSSADLSLSTLYPHLVNVTPTLHVLVFCVCKLSPIIPEAYRPKNTFVPLPLFEIIHHAAVRASARAAKALRSADAKLSNREIAALTKLGTWTRNLLSDQLLMAPGSAGLSHGRDTDSGFGHETGGTTGAVLSHIRSDVSQNATTRLASPHRDSGDVFALLASRPGAPASLAATGGSVGVSSTLSAQLQASRSPVMRALQAPHAKKPAQLHVPLRLGFGGGGGASTTAGSSPFSPVRSSFSVRSAHTPMHGKEERTERERERPVVAPLTILAEYPPPVADLPAASPLSNGAVLSPSEVLASPFSLPAVTSPV